LINSAILPEGTVLKVESREEADRAWSKDYAATFRKRTVLVGEAKSRKKFGPDAAAQWLAYAIHALEPVSQREMYDHVMGFVSDGYRFQLLKLDGRNLRVSEELLVVTDDGVLNRVALAQLVCSLSARAKSVVGHVRAISGIGARATGGEEE